MEREVLTRSTQPNVGFGRSLADNTGFGRDQNRRGKGAASERAEVITILKVNVEHREVEWKQGFVGVKTSEKNTVRALRGASSNSKLLFVTLQFLFKLLPR